MSDVAVNSNSASGATNAAASALGKTKTLSQADFLSLLIQQMRNQDPTQPMDSSQMVSQLAQINQVSATTNLQTSFDALAQSMQGNQQAARPGSEQQTLGHAPEPASASADQNSDDQVRHSSSKRSASTIEPAATPLESAGSITSTSAWAIPVGAPDA